MYKLPPILAPPLPVITKAPVLCCVALVPLEITTLPLMAVLAPIDALPPILTSLVIPTPPATVNAPVDVLVLGVPDTICKSLTVAAFCVTLATVALT